MALWSCHISFLCVQSGIICVRIILRHVRGFQPKSVLRCIPRLRNASMVGNTFTPAPFPHTVKPTALYTWNTYCHVTTNTSGYTSRVTHGDHALTIQVLSSMSKVTTTLDMLTSKISCSLLLPNLSLFVIGVFSLLSSLIDSLRGGSHQTGRCKATRPPERRERIDGRLSGTAGLPAVTFQHKGFCYLLPIW